MNATSLRELTEYRVQEKQTKPLALSEIIQALEQAAQRGENSFNLPACSSTPGSLLPEDSPKWEETKYRELLTIIYALLDLGFSIVATETREYNPEDSGKAYLHHTVKW